MRNYKMSIFIIIWIICGILNFGMTLAYFQDEWPDLAYKGRTTDCVLALWTAALGPLGTIVEYPLSDFAKHGLRFRPISAEASWEYFHKKYPSLDREYWER